MFFCIRLGLDGSYHPDVVGMLFGPVDTEEMEMEVMDSIMMFSSWHK